MPTAAAASCKTLSHPKGVRNVARLQKNSIGSPRNMKYMTVVRLLLSLRKLPKSYNNGVHEAIKNAPLTWCAFDSETGI
jgi:hypothetical protein